MRELLERWSWLEPSRCSEFDDQMGGTGLQVTWTGPPMRAIPDDYPLDALDKALVLAATIEAIEARGWWLDLGSRDSEEHGKYSATVSLTDEPFYKVGWGDTVAEALLAAYLAALEAEGAS